MGSEWQEVSLSNVVELIGGGTPKRKVPEYWGGSIPWLSVKDFNDDLRHVEEAEESITDLGLKESSTKMLFAGQLIISARGTVGALAQLSRPMAFNQSCYGINGKPEYAINDFLYYLIKDSITNLKQITHGAVFDTITRETFDHIIIKLPPLPEQRTIAHILGTLDDKIELNRKMNETLEAMARAIFKSWFVDFDPVRAKMAGRDTGLPKEVADLFPDSFEDSELGEIPKGWGIRSLDDIADFLNGLACQKYPPEGEESLPVIKIRELRQGITENTDRASSNVPKQYIIRDGDVLFSWSGSLLATIWCNGVGVLNQHVFKVSSLKYPKWFYYLWTRRHLEEFQSIAADKATTMGHIKRHHLTDAKVLVPSNKLLLMMDKHLESLVEKQIVNQVETRMLVIIRDTILPKLISGELRVKDAVKFVEATV